MMSAAKILLTAEEFDHYPFDEDKRYELDEGELIEMTRPAYKHNRVLFNLNGSFFNYFKSNPVGLGLVSENLVAIAPRTRLAPDFAIILGDRHEELERATVIPLVPEIVVEVLSPGDQARRMHRKLKQYFDAGVKEVWVLDPATATGEIWTAPSLTFRELATTDSLTSPLLPGFSLPLADLFA
jgi:Uma2 family endonuclease